MDNTKEKLTPMQLVLVICGLICFWTAIFLGMLMFAGVFNAEGSNVLHNVFWVLTTIANLLLACTNWKKQKGMSTVKIGIWSFFLGAFVIMLIGTLMK